MVNIEIIFIDINKYIYHSCLHLKHGAMVIDAITLSGLTINNPEIMTYHVGIFAKLVNHDTILKSGDRLEIYRPLISDPKTKRRARAKIKNKEL